MPSTALTIKKRSTRPDGASGLTFYDRSVVESFAPASSGLDAIFVTALGHSVREPRPPIIDRISRAPGA